MRFLFFFSALFTVCTLGAQNAASADWIMEGYSTAQGVKWLSYHQDGNKATIQILDADLNQRSSFNVDLPDGLSLRYCYFLYDTYLNSDRLFELGVSLISETGKNKVILYNEAGLVLDELEDALSVNLWPVTGLVNSPELQKKDIKLQVTEFSKGLPIHKFYALPLSTVSPSISVKNGEIETLHRDESGKVTLLLPLQMPMGECTLSILDQNGKVLDSYPVKRGKRSFQVDATAFGPDIYYYDVAGIRTGFVVQ
ncbi:MAG: hypothetical protein PUB21_04305 [Bacteroidales bacterium]|nr:hypothetical protein [Bacteroidales bacterium]